MMKQTKRFMSVVLCLVMLLCAVPVSVETHAAGIDNITARADYLYSIKWTARETVKGWRNNYTFYEGETYHIPYGQPVTQGKYVCWGVSIENFLSAANTAGSIFYTTQSYYSGNSGSYSTYYAMDCSALASYCWGLSSRTTTSSWKNLDVTNYGKCTNSNVGKIQQGDALNLSGEHIVIVSRVTNGTYEITEQTPPEVKRSTYSASGLVNKYSSYTIYRYNKRDSVPAAPANLTSPSWASLSIDKEEVRGGENFTFTMASDALIDYYWFTICRASNNEMILSESTNGTFTTSFLSCDHYYAWCSAANSMGSIDSNRVDFYVYGDPPTSGTMTVDRSEVYLGETVTFNFFSNAYYTRNYVAIFDPDGNKCVEGWKEDGFTFTPSKVGSYSGYASLHTVDGGIDTPWLSFSVLCRNHTWNSGTVTSAATCSATGVRTYTCSVCNGTKTETIPVNTSNHVNTTNVAATASTCTAKGYTAGVYCNDCKKYISGHAEQPLNSSNHVNTTNVAATASTCTVKGYTAGVYCNDCKQYISGHEEQPLANHTITIINKQDATYDAAGYTGDEYCTVCKQTIKTGTVIPKLEKPDEPTQPGTQDPPQQNPNACKWCGGTHNGFIGAIVGFFHRILAAIFGARY